MTKKERCLWVGIFFSVFLWSAIRSRYIFIWALEVSPALIGFVILAVTYRFFKFTRLTYWLILIHCVILMIGGHYTYSQVPAFNWLKDAFGLSRNYYDKVGHFAQGFVPAIIARELLIRTSPLKPGKWLFSIVVCICLAISASYELIEWWVALATGTAAEEFLGTQGYIWDTQSDMAWALVGGVVALVTLGNYHNRLISNLFASE